MKPFPYRIARFVLILAFSFSAFGIALAQDRLSPGGKSAEKNEAQQPARSLKPGTLPDDEDGRPRKARRVEEDPFRREKIESIERQMKARAEAARKLGPTIYRRIPSPAEEKLTPNPQIAGWLSAADRNDSDAQMSLGDAYSIGETYMGVKRDAYKAAFFYGSAGSNGVVEAFLNLAHLYLDTTSEIFAPTKGIDYLRKASDAGLEAATIELAERYAMGHGKPRSEAEKPFQLLLARAKDGSEDAATLVAGRYFNGVGTQRDVTEAIRWYREGDGGNHEGFYAREFLAALEGALGEGPHRPGIAVAFDADVLRAAATAVRATERKEPDAQARLGEFYLEGKFVPRSTEKAFDWFRKGASQGSTDAAFDLGLCYRKGIGAKADAAEAFKWFNIAFEGGHKGAGEIMESMAPELLANVLTQKRREASEYRRRLPASRHD